MHFTPSDLPPVRTPEPPAMVSVMSRSDFLWNRPVFRAPPLVVAVPKLDPKSLAEEVRRGVRFDR